jgi:hypothetical protein
MLLFSFVYRAQEIPTVREIIHCPSRGLPFRCDFFPSAYFLNGHGTGRDRNIDLLTHLHRNPPSKKRLSGIVLMNNKIFGRCKEV